MSFVLRTPQARLDLIDAALYIAEDDPAAADRFLDAITETMQRLARHPMLGRTRPELAPELRSFPYRQHVIFYRPVHGGIEVMRVLHGSRDIFPRLEDL